MKAAVVPILGRGFFAAGEEGQKRASAPRFSSLPPSDVPSCPQGYPPTTPGSTASTVEMSPGTLPIPSLSSVAAQSAGMSQAWALAPRSL